MKLSNVERQRYRKTFARRKSIVPIPDLLEMQKNSYKVFLQADTPTDKRENIGLESCFRSIFPIVSINNCVTLEYVGYTFSKQSFTEQECRIKGISYATKVYARIRVSKYSRETMAMSPSSSDRKPLEVKVVDTFMGEIPLMTENGCFVINGTDRVVVSQLHRSPGVFFESDDGRTHSSNKLLFSARIIPYRGSWLDLEFDIKDILYFRVDKRRKMLVSTLLRATGMSIEDMLAYYYELEEFPITKDGVVLKFSPERWLGEFFHFDILNKNGVVIVSKDTRITKNHISQIKAAGITEVVFPHEFLIGKIVSTAVVDPETGEFLVGYNEEIVESNLKKIVSAKIDKIRCIFTNDLDRGAYLSNTIRADDNIQSVMSAKTAIYKMMRPGDPPTPDAVESLYHRLFFSTETYDLSKVGRMKFNSRVGYESMVGPSVLTSEDIHTTVKLILDLRNGKGYVDDIDNLGNRRVRCVGELVENQVRIGLVRIEKAVKERLGQLELEQVEPNELVNAKPITNAVKEFFMSSQLSQFMEQTNPLAELTHKRRVSALGPGGLNRERAGFEVRDVHVTHYGRVCPIETPEGANIGLINSLSLYARLNHFGFIETPYRKVVNGHATNIVEYLSVIEEVKYVIAQANAGIDKNGILTDEHVSVRIAGESTFKSADKVQYMDISPAQIVSVAASLLPFLEHDDANRALMGANMQRQAVASIKPQAPLVGTGSERAAALYSGTMLFAKNPGLVDYVDSNRIVIKSSQGEGDTSEYGLDSYHLSKYQRTNQNTTIHQRPLVKVGQAVQQGDVLADGSATDLGELALGQNVLVAFMPWNGYNFEDSILVSERLIADDRFTSVHIQELVAVARETKQGNEEISNQIPNISLYQANQLDDAGIVRIGTEVSVGDILVGKLSPKGDEVTLSSEEKLLRAIFGDKVSNSRDTSLRVDQGSQGVVIDVKILNRERGSQKNKSNWSSAELNFQKRDQEIIESDLKQYDTELRKQFDLKKDRLIQNVEKLLLDQKLLKDKGKPRSKAVVINQEYLDTIGNKFDYFSLNLDDGNVALELQKLKDQYVQLRTDYDTKIKEMKVKLNKGDDLPPGVIKMVKVYVAVKRRLQPGDKMAGRHGNKGVVSKIVAVEDMPHLVDGTPCDIVLNPLGVPSRMNIGQIFEVHLGWAAKGLGDRIDDLIKNQSPASDIRKFLKVIYHTQGVEDDFLVDELSDDEIMELADNLVSGVPCATPVFDGALESDIHSLLKLAYPDDIAKQKGLTANRLQAYLYDGKTGERFERPVTIGYMYMLKLHHLVEEKIHARSTGPYSLVTQQPLGGRAKFGGQRFGEMEVWALEAYGAAYTLQEMLTVKSDDLTGRARILENIVKGKHQITAGMPESFNVLLNEIRSLGLNIDLISHKVK
ncbi:MAG: DNA-directed RNA polymerase subunit beta [Gammaproteobacteria bacterium]|nr:DNA-directed RNA polymerase subunit beta [Gammaproteobacteria bacterium]